MDLLRGCLVFLACSIGPLVDNGEQLLAMSRRLLGSSVIDAVLRHTFFAHFVAGAHPAAFGLTTSKSTSGGLSSNALTFEARRRG
jgi:proline dehydrogenase